MTVITARSEILQAIAASLSSGSDVVGLSIHWDHFPAFRAAALVARNNFLTLPRHVHALEEKMGFARSDAVHPFTDCADERTVVLKRSVGMRLPGQMLIAFGES